MIKLKNIEGLTVEQVNEELQKGAKFVVFTYCISIIIMTFKRSSNVYFIRANESTIKHSIGYTLLSLILGWWGIPWGPIYTIGALYTNLSGGKDVTGEVLDVMNSN